MIQARLLTLDTFREQDFVPQAAVEALGVGVLDRLPRPDEVMLDAVAVGPGVEGAAGELGAVVGADRPRLPLGLDRLVQDPGHSLGGKGNIELKGDAAP